MTGSPVISFAMYSHAKAVQAAAFAIRAFDSQARVPTLSWPHLTGILFEADCHHINAHGRPVTGEEWRVTSQGIEPSGLKAVLDGDPVALAQLTAAGPSLQLLRDPSERSRIRAELPDGYGWRGLSESDRDTIMARLGNWRALDFAEALHHGRRLAIPLMAPGGRIPYEAMIADPDDIAQVLDFAGFGHFGD